MEQKKNDEIAGMSSFSEMVQLIMQNDYVYSFLIYFYLEDISSWEFEELVREECQKGKTQREVHAYYFASWIPCEKNVAEIMESIELLSIKP